MYRWNLAALRAKCYMHDRHSGEPVPIQPVYGDATASEASEEAAEQCLRRIPEDPGGLLRRKFLFQYQLLGVDQDGNYVWPGDEEQPW